MVCYNTQKGVHIISQNERILDTFKGTGKTFTARFLEGRMHISRPSARIFDLRSKGYDVRTTRFTTNYTIRSAVKYQIMRSRA